MNSSRAFSQGGGVMIEYLIGATMTLLLLGGVVQCILLYKANLHLQQATFEAARFGAVNHGNRQSMLNAFADQLVDMHISGVSNFDFTRTFIRSHQAVHMPILAGGAGVNLTVINPSTAALTDFGTGNPRRIPNSWQQARATELGERSGLSLQDANILKITITYAYPLQVPVLDRLIGRTLSWFDRVNSALYLGQTVRVPIRSSAVIHMQSDYIEQGIEL